MSWVALLALVACSGKDGDATSQDNTVDSSVVDTSTAVTADRAPSSSCDPLDPSVCALPWPSSYFQVPDEVEESGWRYVMADDTLPRSKDDVQVSPSILNRTDGYSTMTPLMAFFGEVDLQGTVSHLDLGAHLDADTKTVLIDVETGERVPHFVELDHLADEGERVLFLRPVVPLRHSAHYVVGLRNLALADGSPLPLSEHFLALRDGGGDDPDLAWRRAQFDADVFPVLEAEGFERGSVQLAWDFHTVSVEASVGDMVFMRDDALERWEASDKNYTLTEVEDADCTVDGATIARTIYGTFTCPRYTELDGPSTRLARDAADRPTVAGDTEVEFIVRIPCSVADQPGGMLLQYGHGLLGDLGETRTGWLSAQANRDRYVLYGQTWIGMAEEDRFPILGMIDGNFSDFPMVPERSMQGLVQKLVGLRFARDVLANDAAMSFAGGPAITPGKVGYYGNSQGGILGGAYLALSTDLERGVLGVAGMPYSLLLARSADFGIFLIGLQEQFRDGRELAVVIGSIQNAWDAAEAGGYAHFLNAEPLPNTPPHEALIQVGVGDAQVTTLGAHIMARAYGATTVGPAHRPIWGVDERSAPYTGSALVEWYYPDGSTEPVENVPPELDTDTHECARRELEAQAQILAFVEDGTIIQPCNGACEGVREGFCD